MTQAFADAFALFSGSPLNETSVFKPKKKRKLSRKTGSNVLQSTPYKVLGTFGEVECKKRRTQQPENKTSCDSNGFVNNNDFVSHYLRDCFEDKPFCPRSKTNTPELNVDTSKSNGNTWETAAHVHNQSVNIETNSFQSANNNQVQTSVSVGGKNHPMASNAPDDVVHTAKVTNGTANLDSFSIILNDIIESSNQFESNNSSQSSQEYSIPITSSQATEPGTAPKIIDSLVARQQRQGNPVQTQTYNEQFVSTGIPMASSCIPKANVVYPNVTAGSKGSISTYSTRGIDFLSDSDEAISRFFHQANPSSISEKIPEQTIYTTESNYVNPNHQNINIQPHHVHTQPASTHQAKQQAYMELYQKLSQKSKSQTMEIQLAYPKQKELTQNGHAQTSLVPQTAVMTALQQQSNPLTQSDYSQQASINPSKIQKTLPQEALRLSPSQISHSMVHQASAHITPPRQELMQVLTQRAKAHQAKRQSPPIQQPLTLSSTQPLQTAYSQSAPTQNSYRHQAQQHYTQLAHTQPQLTQPQYSQPTLTQSQYSQPSLTQPQYIQPPQYSQPPLTQPQYSQPSLSQPQYIKPPLTQPQYSQPPLTQPQYSQPSLSQPQYIQPPLKQTQYSQPPLTQPQYNQPPLTQPQYSQPSLTQPQYSQSTPQTLNHLPTPSANNKERLDAKRRELEYYLTSTSFSHASDSYTPATAMNSSHPMPTHSPTPNPIMASPSDRLPERSTIPSSPDPSLSSYQVSDASSPQAEDELSSTDSFYLNTLPSLCFA